jgi:hypothetical protein
MRSIIIVLAALICGIMLATPPSCFALVTGNGSMSFTFGTNPDLINEYAYFYVGDSPGSYTNGPTTGGTVTNGHSTTSIPDIVSTAYPNPGDPIPSNSFSFSAQAPSAGITGMAYADIIGSDLYGSYYVDNISILPAFSYTYTFNGHVDSSNDGIQFTIQLEVSYTDAGGITLLYSDYNSSAPVFQTKMVSLNDPDQNGDLSQSGTVSFGPFDAGQEVTWYVSWDLIGNGQDQLPGGNTVPIPGTILLFAPGLAGIALLRRRLKK